LTTVDVKVMRKMDAVSLTPPPLQPHAFIDGVPAFAWSALQDGSLELANQACLDYTGFPWTNFAPTGNRCCTPTTKRSTSGGGMSSRSSGSPARRKLVGVAPTGSIAGSTNQRRPFMTREATSSDGTVSMSTSMIASAQSNGCGRTRRTCAPSRMRFGSSSWSWRRMRTLYANKVALESTGFTLRDFTDVDLLTRAGVHRPAPVPGQPHWNQVWRLAGHLMDRDRLQVERQRGFFPGDPIRHRSAPSLQDRAIPLATISVQPAEGRAWRDHPLVRDVN
jgi:hypothetical protein